MQDKTCLTHEMASMQPVDAANALPHPAWFKRRICNSLLLVCLGIFLGAGCAEAQGIDTLGPQVRKYVSVSSPKIILEHVQIIDGTGAAPIPDQNISIEGG